MSTETATRKEIIDTRLRKAGWNLTDRTQVIEEFFVSTAGDEDEEAGRMSGLQSSFREFSDYVLIGKNGKPLAVVEAKKSSVNAEVGREQANSIVRKSSWRMVATFLFASTQMAMRSFFGTLVKPRRREFTASPHDRTSNAYSSFASITNPSPRS